MLNTENKMIKTPVYLPLPFLGHCIFQVEMDCLIVTQKW